MLVHLLNLSPGFVKGLTPVRSEAAFIYSPYSCFFTKPFKEKTGLVGRAPQHVKKGSSGNSGRSRPRFLLPFVCNDKEIRGMETCHRFKDAEQADCVSPFQDGKGTVAKSSATNKRMGCLGRPLRRVLSPSGSSHVQ